MYCSLAQSDYTERTVKHPVPYCNCIYNRLLEDEHSGSRHVEDMKIKQ